MRAKSPYMRARICADMRGVLLLYIHEKMLGFAARISYILCALFAGHDMQSPVITASVVNQQETHIMRAGSACTM